MVMTAGSSERLMLWSSALTGYERTGSSVPSRIFCGKAKVFWLVCSLGCLAARLCISQNQKAALRDHVLL